MQLDRYVAGLLRRWYVVAGLVGIGVLTAWLYFTIDGTTSAATTVSVLDPAVAQSVEPGGVAAGGQARPTFSSVVQSRLLAERVIQKLGLNMPVEAMQGKISAKLGPSQVPNVTPLYTIQVKDHDPQRAVLYADTVVEEGRQVYAGLIASDSTPDNQGFQAQEQQLQQQQAAARDGVQKQLTQAQAELERLRGLLPAYSTLVVRRDEASSALNQYATRASDAQLAGQTQAVAAIRAAEATAHDNLRAALDALSLFQRDNGIDDLPANIATQATLVNNLRGQLAGTAGATGDLKTAEDLMSALKVRQMEMTLNSSANARLQVQVLDSAYVVPNLTYLILVHLLGGALGAFVGLVVVYVLEYVDHSPRTADDAGDLVGAPVLLRLPEAS